MTWLWGFAITCAWIGAAVVLFITGMWTGAINDGPRYSQCNPVSYEGRERLALFHPRSAPSRRESRPDMTWAWVVVAFLAGWLSCWYLSSFLIKRVLRKGDSMMTDASKGSHKRLSCASTRPPAPKSSSESAESTHEAPRSRRFRGNGRRTGHSGLPQARRAHLGRQIRPRTRILHRRKPTGTAHTGI